MSINFLQAQSQEERDLINEYSIQANKLIWHLNKNTENLRDYQIALNNWYLNSEPFSAVPKLLFEAYEYEKDITFLLSQRDLKPNKTGFYYQANLSDLNKKIAVFNTLCHKLMENNEMTSTTEFYQQQQDILRQIDEMAPDLVTLCYDFSLSCAINYGKENQPDELANLKNIVGQAKNVIMAIRENSPIQVKAYLHQLNEHIIVSSKFFEYDVFKRLGRFYLNEYELNEKHDKILSTANDIAYWGEQYLQSNLNVEQVLPILENAILAFNVNGTEAGCAATYNELVANSKNRYLFFTEEPMFFEVKEQKKPIKNEKVEEEKLLTTTSEMQNETIVIEEVTADSVVFDADDFSSLDGALPNNIIIMMDVSASMKLNGKLPLLKSSILNFLDIMRPEDKLSLIAYSGEAELLIEGAGIENTNSVKLLLDKLHSRGGTDIDDALDMAYNTIRNSYMEGGNNRIIIATDGEFGVRAALLKKVRENVANKIFLSVFQFNDNDTSARNVNLRALAETGKGSYRTITSREQALKELILEVKKK